MDISPEELKKQINFKDTVIIVVDVREDWEFEQQHITPNNIPLYSIPQRLEEFKKWKDKKVVLHCNSGKRSQQAQKFLRKQGFENIINLIGGLDNYLRS